MRIFETGGDRYEAERERGDDCNNTLPIAPTVAGAYGRSVDSEPGCATPATRSSRSPPRGAAAAALHVLPDRS